MSKIIYLTIDKSTTDEAVQVSERVHKIDKNIIEDAVTSGF
ncbi:hypothetical protein [Nitrosopumilus sp.]|nr:hypothetical protein [Nitrosopumilus sp.]